MIRNLKYLVAASVFVSACGDDGNDDDGSSAETHRFTVSIENVAPLRPFTSAGVFNTPRGDSEPGPATPGKSYEFTIHAGRTQKLSFVTMLAATNDLFYAPGGDGIAFYDEDGEPISGDVTDQVYLWDAGTEVNEEPRVGPNTVSKQDGPDTGPDEDGDVLAIEDVKEGESFDYPPVSDVLNVSIEHVEGTKFVVTLTNVSTDDALQTSEGDFPAPISPGVWVVHRAPDPLFSVGMPDRGQGIEHIAEDGNPTDLAEFVTENTGVTFPASPGVWVVHTKGSHPLYTEGEADYGDGVEHIAEDGNPMMLAEGSASLEGVVRSDVFNMPVGSDDPGPIVPGSRYEFSFDASSGQRLSFVSMLAATNDAFFGPSDSGIALFDKDGMPLDGDITDQVYLWDAGTEANEEPLVGPNTVTNQPKPDTGIKGEGSVQHLSDVDGDDFDYPDVDSLLKVEISAD